MTNKFIYDWVFDLFLTLFWLYIVLGFVLKGIGWMYEEYCKLRVTMRHAKEKAEQEWQDENIEEDPTEKGN